MVYGVHTYSMTFYITQNTVFGVYAGVYIYAACVHYTHHIQCVQCTHCVQQCTQFMHCKKCIHRTASIISFIQCT